MISEEDFKKKEHSARWALYYIDKVASKLPFKLKSLKTPTEEFKILIHDEIHKYDSDGIELAKKTFKRKNFNFDMRKYRIMSTGKYAYIFAMSKMKA